MDLIIYLADPLIAPEFLIIWKKLKNGQSTKNDNGDALSAIDMDQNELHPHYVFSTDFILDTGMPYTSLASEGLLIDLPQKFVCWIGTWISVDDWRQWVISLYTR